MTETKKINPILFITLVAPITLLMSYLYYCGATVFFDYTFKSEMAIAEIISTAKKVNKYTDGCIFKYNYDAGGKRYSGEDEIAVDCPKNATHIRIFYLKNIPNKSIIGLDVFLLFFPLVLILYSPSWIRKYRHVGNRKKYSIFYMVNNSAFLILAASAMAFYSISPLQVKDASASTMGGIIIICWLFSMYEFYKNYTNYRLYNDGKSIKAIITNIKEELNVGRDMIINRKIFYEYELAQHQYTGSETLPEKESSKYKIGEAISLLYHPHKKHISCIDA